jgi:hypothetical protein
MERQLSGCSPAVEESIQQVSSRPPGSRVNQMIEISLSGPVSNGLAEFNFAEWVA